MSLTAFVNGVFLPLEKATISIEDRGFQFADGVYEVIAVIHGKFADEEAHLDRLERSLAELRIDMPYSREDIKGFIRTLVEKNNLNNATVYIQITRGVAPRNFAFPKGVAPTCVMTARAFDFALSEKHIKGAKAISVPDLRWKRRDIKSLLLLPQVLAKQAAVDAGAVEALLLDEDGTINEGASSNFWVVKEGGVIATRSPAQSKILKGITRTAVFDLGARENIPIHEEFITLEDAYNASEAFITGASSLVTPIVQIDDRVIGDGKVGPITQKLRELYLDYVQNPPDSSLRWTA